MKRNYVPGNENINDLIILDNIQQKRTLCITSWTLYCIQFPINLPLQCQFSFRRLHRQNRDHLSRPHRDRLRYWKGNILCYYHEFNGKALLAILFNHFTDKVPTGSFLVQSLSKKLQWAYVWHWPKQIFLFSFEPKNERNYFLISALRI